MTVRRRIWVVLALAVCGPGVASGAVDDAAGREPARPLSERLHAADVDVRRKAAIDLRTSERTVQRDALPVMIELLGKEKDGQVRLALFDVLTGMGHDAASAVPVLVHTLHTDFGGSGSEASHQDYRSALALSAIGKPAVDGLRGVLTERKPGVRAEAAMALGRIGADARAAVPDLVLLLKDKVERVRHEASTALGRLGSAAIEPLVAAAGQNDETVRVGAVEGLAGVSEPSDVVNHAVFKCARDPSPSVRTAAMNALSRLKLPDAALREVVLENIAHDDETVRVAVINLLVDRRSLLAQIAPAVELLLTAKSEGISRHAAYLLARTGSDAAPRLIGALQNDSSRVPQIAEALAQIGRPVAPSLRKALTSSNPRVRRGAALALGQIRPLAEGTVAALADGLADSESAVTSDFLTAIGYLGGRASEAVPKVRGLLHDKSPEIRMKAILVLAQSAPRDEAFVTDLMAMLGDSDAGVERQAIDILRSLGPKSRRALPAVIGKLNSSDPGVRLAAAEMIGSHGPAASAAVPALGKLLDDPAPRLRTVAAQTLGTMGKEAQPALDRLTTLLDAPQVEVREAAATTLGALELDADALRPHLARALRDARSEVRRAAMKAIQRMGPQGALFVPDIILMAENKENVRMVERALKRFERSGPDVRSVPELVKQLEHKQDSVRLLAIRFLKLAGPGAKDALPALERMRDDPSAEVRKQAISASEQIKKKSTTSAAERSAAHRARDARRSVALEVSA